MAQQGDYELPNGVYVDFADDLQGMQSHAPMAVERHKQNGCRACIAGPEKAGDLSYWDLLQHWIIRQTPLACCASCRRPYPEAEYIICEFAKICRHCSVQERAHEKQDIGLNRHGITITNGPPELDLIWSWSRYRACELSLHQPGLLKHSGVCGVSIIVTKLEWKDQRQGIVLMSGLSCPTDARQIRPRPWRAFRAEYNVQSAQGEFFITG